MSTSPGSEGVMMLAQDMEKVISLRVGMSIEG